ncbi:hypothetical protein BDW75DRAFT_213136 [Aspergillus navahoensis]
MMHHHVVAQAGYMGQGICVVVSIMVLLDHWSSRGRRKDDRGWCWGYLYRLPAQTKGPFCVWLSQTVSY